MRQLALVYSVIFIPTIAANRPWWLGPFDLSGCSQRITALLDNSTISFANNATIFAHYPDGTLISNDTSSPVTTPSACDTLCSADARSPSNSFQRLINWFIPIVLLVMNVYYAEIGWKTYLAAFRLLGDPIDSMWSLLSILCAWNSYIADAKDPRRREDPAQKMRERDVAAILCGLRCSQVTWPNVYDRWLHGSGLNAAQLDARIQKTARKLTEGRALGMLRASGALLLYLWQVIAAFVPAIGGDTQPSGGMIGPAMLFSWLLPIVLLSNAIGGFNSPNACRRILLNFLRRVRDVGDGSRYDQFNTISDPVSPLWTGGIPFYQPNKSSSTNARVRITLFTVSALPALIAFGTAFAVLYTPPTYLTCRHFLILFILLLWLLSVGVTWTISRYSSCNPKLIFYCTLAKDVVLSLLIVGLLIATSCDLFTSCWCLSGYWNFGVYQARVYLNPAKDYGENSGRNYPISVSVCFVAQFVFFIAAVVYGSEGFRTWRGKNEA